MIELCWKENVTFGGSRGHHQRLPPNGKQFFCFRTFPPKSTRVRGRRSTPPIGDPGSATGSCKFKLYFHRSIIQIPDIALMTPCGTLHALLREENENYHEMSVDTPTVPPCDLSLIQYIQAHVQWYNNTAVVTLHL